MPKKEKQHWFLRLIGAPFLGEIEDEADVRWFSECNVDERTCMGHLLGHWHIFEAHIEPAEYDFRPYPEDLELLEWAFVTYAHNIIVDFAFTPDEASCALKIIDLKGRVAVTHHPMPDGLRSRTLGQPIGPTLRQTIDRTKPGACVPVGWRPHQSDSS